MFEKNKTTYHCAPPITFTFTEHAKEMLKANAPQNSVSGRKEGRKEEKKVKANGKRGRGKGAIE